jgi:hypothetical protein
MITNLTPHSITVIRDNGTQITYQSGQPVARVSQDTAPVGLLDDGVPAVTTQFGDIVNLPDPVPGFYFLVSGLVAQRAWALGRTDVVCPGSLFRDQSGNVVGCQHLLVSPHWIG